MIFVLRIIVVQFERGEALEKIAQDVKRELEEECDEESLRVLSKAVDTVRKEVAVQELLLLLFSIYKFCYDRSL